MFSLLYQYLINCGHVALPGIGTLQFAYSPAQTKNDGQIAPPKQTLILKNEEDPTTVQKLLSFLSKQLDLSETQAYTIFQHFLATIKTALAEDGTMAWENVGSIKKDKDGAIYFQQNEAIANYFQPITTSWVYNETPVQYDVLVGENETNNFAIQEGLDEEKGTKSSWWIWAILIAVAALVVIAFRFAG